jgi:hypothetical protein
MDRRHFRVVRILVYATVFITFAILIVLLMSVSKAQPAYTPIHYLVQIDVRNDNIKYTVTPTPNLSGCKFPTSDLKPGDVPLCKNDTVEWQGISKGNSHELVVYVGGNVLNKTSYSESNGMKTERGSINSSVPSENKYFVHLFEKIHSLPYDDDPKIIIGSGSDL